MEQSVEYIDIRLNYVDELFENEVLKLIKPKKAGTKLHRNQVLRWGSRIPYDNGIVSGKIPIIFDKLSNQIAFDSVTVNEYMKGQKIDWHIDKPASGNEIKIISLLSDSVLNFRLKDGYVSFEVPRFSMTTFGGDLRWLWEHSLLANEKRVSVVFRNSIEKINNLGIALK